MSKITDIIDVYGAITSIVLNPGGILDDFNLAAQLAATGAGDAAKLNPLLASAAVAAGGAALGLGSAVLARDIMTGASGETVSSDALSVVGDIAIVAGGIAEETDKPLGIAIGSACEYIGAGATAVGASADNYEAAQGFIANSPGLQSFLNEGERFLNDIQSIDSSLASVFSDADSPLSTAWGLTQQSFSDSLGAVSDVLSSFENSGDSDGAAFISAANLASTDLINIQTPMDTLAGASGSETAEDITETASGDAVTTDSSSDSALVSTVDFGTSDDGSTSTIGVESENSGGSPAAVTYDATAGSITTVDQENDDGTSAITTYNADNSTTTDYGGPDGTGTVTEIDQENADGTSAITTYNSDGSSTTTNYSVDSNGTIVETTMNSDGSIVRSIYDSSTGGLISAATFGNSGNLESLQTSTDIKYDQYVASVADAIAGQVIIQFLVKNNQPVALALQALADAGVQSFAAGTDFSTALTSSLNLMASNLVQSALSGPLSNEVTGFLDSLGLPSPLSGAIGNALGSAVTQQLTQAVVKVVFDAPTISTVVDGSLDPIDFAASLGSKLGDALESAGLSLAGSELAGALVPSNNTPAQIGGDIGSVIGTALLGPFVGPLAPFIGDFVGTLLGDLWNSIIGGRGTPFADGHLDLSGNQLSNTSNTEDNEGQLQVSTDMEDNVAGVINSILADIVDTKGANVASTGTATLSTGWNVGYYKDLYFSFDGQGWPPSGQNEYVNADDAVANAIMSILANVQFSGTIDPVLVYALDFGEAAAAATTGSASQQLPVLLSDFDAAYDYVRYAANPAAFDEALAVSGSETQYQSWQSELALVSNMGIVDQDVPCFCTGTRISTARGDVAVERLRAGDHLVLARGGTASVVWIGRRRINCRRHPRPQDVLPVRIRAGAFGVGSPAQDLILSPDHSVFVHNALIPIRYLINDASIVQEQREEVTYWHVELDRHDVVLAEGLPCESYLDTGNRGAFANAGPAVQLHPDFALKVWKAEGCAPLVLDGPLLIAAKQRLLAQATALGHDVTDDPSVRVLAGDQELAAETDGRQWRVRLPGATKTVRLTSRVWRPAHTRVTEDDTRLLGVAISRMWLDRREVSLESPGLSVGWHAPEPGWRWTAGDAELALDGVRELAFEVAMTGTYWQNQERREVRAA